MNVNLNDKYAVDVLASEAGGYTAPPSEYGIAYTNLLFEICAQFGIRYYSATPKERYFVEEVTRVTWAKNEEERTGAHQPTPEAFSARPRI